jgi:D-3-phosphoglycerate dehydrogenase / 2-oxoglutarate reductase
MCPLSLDPRWTGEAYNSSIDMSHTTAPFDTVESLILDMLEWIGPSGRASDEVLEAWRTSCPRLTVWEDASEKRFVTRRIDADRGAWIDVTPAGAAFLHAQRP